MPNAETAGRRPPHWSIVGLLTLTILGAVPLALGVVARGGGPTAMSSTVFVPVSRPAPMHADATPVRPVTKDAPVRLDARTLMILFKDKNYSVDEVRGGISPVPRLVLADLPTDIDAIDSIDDRKALFFKAMLPLILMANEEIERDRERLVRLHRQKTSGSAIAPKDRFWLARLAERYGISYTGEVDTGALLARVDIVPPSLALAQAVEESGWGTSRFAQDGNALFGQLTWNEKHAGIVPRNRQQGETHRFRAFENPMASVRSYVHNLNTHRAYRQFRVMRASMRSQGKSPDGLRLAAALAQYSERGEDYVRTLRAVIRSNDLTDFDRAVLDHPAEAAVPVEASARP